MTDLRDLLHRLLRAWMWILGQFIGTAIFLIIGLAWTRLPDSHVWQVALTLIIPLLLAISVLELEAATMRSLADNDGRRVKLVLGALTFLIWIALGCVAWLVLNWCDEQLPQWSGYLNSRTSAHWRAKVLTYQHIQHGLTIVEWILRWIVVPGKLIPMAMASAQWGLRIPLGRIIRLLFSGRWWLGVVVITLAAEALPTKLFTSLPRGTVSAQVWHVSLKLAAAYVLIVGGWVLLLAWLAVLFSRFSPDESQHRSGPTDSPDDKNLVGVGVRVPTGPPGSGKTT